MPLWRRLPVLTSNYRMNTQGLKSSAMFVSFGGSSAFPSPPSSYSFLSLFLPLLTLLQILADKPRLSYFPNRENHSVCNGWHPSWDISSEAWLWFCFALFFSFLPFFLDRIQYSPSWQCTPYVAEAILELLISCLSPSPLDSVHHHT